MPYRYAIVLDFEATCVEMGAPDPQEIIEFPSVLVDLTTGEVVDEFEAFVRPLHHPTLSPFCRELTSIRQTDVDEAEPFVSVFARHQAWLAEHGIDVNAPEPRAFAPEEPDLTPAADLAHMANDAHTADAEVAAGHALGRGAVIVTCGDWDLLQMLPKQVRTAELTSLPLLYSRWLNIKVPFKALFGPARVGMARMLKALDLPLIGHHHRGIDDSRNIARILLALQERGARVEVSGRLAAKHWPPLPLTLVFEGAAREVTLSPRVVSTLKGLAGKVFGQKLKRLTLPSGEPLTDEALIGLAPGTRIECAPRVVGPDPVPR